MSKPGAGTSIVIPYINEPLLDFTVDEVKRTAPGAELILIEDIPQKGNSRRRHEGILRAKNNTVLILDAHMGMAHEWADSMAAFLDIQPKAVICCRCGSLDADKLVVLDAERYGARLHELVVDSKGRRRVLQPKWNRERPDTLEPMRVACTLGGCYGIRRDWYIDGLGAPWQYHQRWGSSESIISLMSYLCGGSSWVLPAVQVAHWFRKSHGLYTIPRWCEVANQMLMVQGMVERREDRDRLFALWELPPNRAPGYGCKTLNKMGAIEAVRAHLKKHGARTYRDFKREWMNG